MKELAVGLARHAALREGEARQECLAHCSYGGLLGEGLDAVGAEREGDLAVLASVVDAFDQEFNDAGLVAGGEGFPRLVKVGEEVRGPGFVDLVGADCGEFAVDLGQAALGGVQLILQVGELGDAPGRTRQADGRLQVGMVGSELLLALQRTLPKCRNVV